MYKHKPLYISYVIIMVLGIYALIMGRYVSLDNIDIFAQYSVGKGEYITKELREFIVANGEVPDVKNEYNIENSGDVYSFEAKDGNVVLPLAYYKGYKISDSKKVYEYTQDTGLIKVEGVDESQLKVEYKGTITQKVSLAVSLATFIGILSGCLFKRGKYERKNK